MRPGAPHFRHFGLLPILPVFYLGGTLLPLDFHIEIDSKEGFTGMDHTVHVGGHRDQAYMLKAAQSSGNSHTVIERSMTNLVLQGNFLQQFLLDFYPRIELLNYCVHFSGSLSECPLLSFMSIPSLTCIALSRFTQDTWLFYRAF